MPITVDCIAIFPVVIVKNKGPFNAFLVKLTIFTWEEVVREYYKKGPWKTFCWPYLHPSPFTLSSHWQTEHIPYYIALASRHRSCPQHKKINCKFLCDLTEQHGGQYWHIGLLSLFWNGFIFYLCAIDMNNGKRFSHVTNPFSAGRFYRKRTLWRNKLCINVEGWFLDMFWNPHM